jgi:DNA polymerase-3 subunit beta
VNLTVERTDLNAAMQRVRGIVGNKNVPLLNNVLLIASDNRLTIRATNLDMEATEEIAANITTDGETTVPADMLAEIARNLPAGAVVSMSIDDKSIRLVVKSGRSRFNLGMLPAADFPSLAGDDWPFSFTIKADALAQLIGRVSFAQELRPTYAYLMGVYLDHKNDGVRMVATNRNMIAYHDGPKVDPFDPVTIPSPVVVQLARMAGQSDDIVISFSKTKLQAVCGMSSITAKLMDQSLKFPPYERVIPKESPNGATIDVEAVTGAIRRALISSGGAREQTVRLTFNSGALACTAKNDISDAFDEIEIGYDGPETAFGFNPQYLLDMLGSIAAETVVVGFGDKRSPTIWIGAGDENGAVIISPQVV